jgi:catechol 2,3-dioxygenase-like lactoylglutathione lyase family enzyme
VTAERSYRLVAVDHVQLAMPAGEEAERAGEAFFTGLLGLERVAKPPRLAARGGCWFTNGDVTIHLGVEEGFRPARKAHPAIVVLDLPSLLGELEEAGHATLRAEEVPGRPQFYVDDPFGNRLELIPGQDATG